MLVGTALQTAARNIGMFIGARFIIGKRSIRAWSSQFANWLAI